MSDLPFIDEHQRRVEASTEAVWAALLEFLRREELGAAWLARLLGCDPARRTTEFSGLSGEAVPGFRVIAAEPGRRLVLAGRHRFAVYELSFLWNGETLRAETRAAFPGLLGRLYRAMVIGSGGHRIITRHLLRQVARRAERGPERPPVVKRLRNPTFPAEGP